MTEVARLFTVTPHEAVSYYILLFLMFAGPLSIAIGALLPPRVGRPFLLAALVFLGLETTLFFLAAPGQNPAQTVPQDEAVLIAAAETTGIMFETKAMFLGLFGIYAAVLSIPLILHRLESRLFSTALPLSFLVLYSAGTVFWLTTGAP